MSRRPTPGEKETIAIRNYRVRKSAADGPKVVAFFETLGKATVYAKNQMRNTGRLMRVERRIVLGKGWETAAELAPDTTNSIELRIARGHLPAVQDGTGRKGQVLSYIRPARSVRVAWADVAAPGKGEIIAVDQLTLA